MRERNRLTPLQVKNLTEPGLYADGGNLYLQITTAQYQVASGEVRYSMGKTWIFKYTRTVIDEDGNTQYRTEKIGLGSASRITLKQARELASELNYDRARGIDVKAQTRAKRAALKQSKHATKTLRSCSLARIKSKSVEWKSGGKSEAQWTQSLTDHVFPIIGDMPIASVTVRDIANVLTPLWTDKTETARRIQQRLADIFQWSIAMGYSEPPNPASWSGNLENVLPKPSKFQKVKNFAAVPYTDLPGMIEPIMSKTVDPGFMCLVFTTVMACRSHMARKTVWSDFDLDNGVWRVPSERMKRPRDYTSPIPAGLVEILREIPKSAKTDLVFPSVINQTAMSDVSLKKKLTAVGGGDFTIHGLRGSFKSWSLETGQDQTAVEMQLAHTVGSGTVAAYIRTDLFDLRREILESWFAYLRHIRVNP